MCVLSKTFWLTLKGCEWGYLVFHRKRLEPRVLPSRCHSVSFMMYSAGPSLKNTALKFLELFSIEGCAVLVKPSIHRMQIWRTARSSTWTSCMKVRLVRLRCFVLAIVHQKSLRRRSGVLYFAGAYELLCLWMLGEGIELFHCSPRELRENSGDEGKEFTFGT